MKGMFTPRSNHDTYEALNRTWLTHLRMGHMVEWSVFEKQEMLTPGKIIVTVGLQHDVYVGMGTIFGNVYVGGCDGRLKILYPVQLAGILNRAALYSDDIYMIFGVNRENNLNTTLVNIIDLGSRVQEDH